MRDIVVIKLGGSHATSPHLRACLAALEAGRSVVVPGGGPFADAVRAAQVEMRFDDDAAHDMALMAMAQFGRALTALAPGLVYADDLGAVLDAVGAGRVPVWSPWPSLRAHPEIPMSWDVTSDSLALWLAREIGARELVLLKHQTAAAGLVEWMRDGVVDPAFATFRAGFAGNVRVETPERFCMVSA